MQDSEKDTDPVEAADDEQDLYGISTWERRSLLDSVSVAIYRENKASASGLDPEGEADT